jgi:hypothetical protein
MNQQAVRQAAAALYVQLNGLDGGSDDAFTCRATTDTAPGRVR